MKVLLQILFLSFILVGCKNQDPIMDDLNSVKKHLKNAVYVETNIQI